MALPRLLLPWTISRRLVTSISTRAAMTVSISDMTVPASRSRELIADGSGNR